MNAHEQCTLTVLKYDRAVAAVMHIADQAKKQGRVSGPDIADRIYSAVIENLAGRELTGADVE